MTTIIDNFDRSDGSLGSDWNNAGGLDFEINSNQAARSGTGTTWSAMRHVTPTGNADHEAQAEVHVQDIGSWTGVGVRLHSTNNTGYIGIISSAGEIRFYKWNSGLNGQIGSSTSTTLPSLPFTFKVKVVGNDLFAFVNGTQKASVTDSGATFPSDQNVGIVTQVAINRFDNFVAGDLTADISINLAPFTTFQRNPATNTGTISFQATWNGTPTAIESRWNSGNWITVDSNPFGGISDCELTGLPPGQGTLEVRFANETAISESVANILLGDVFLVAGQSNAEGRANGPQSYSHATLKAAMYNSAGWQELSDPTHPVVDSNGSVWPLVATDLLTSQNVPVAFICTAKGGTQLHNGTWHSPSGVEYQAAVSAFQNSNTNAISAVLWHQGEADASSGVSTSDYKSALNNFASDFASDLTFIDGPKILVAQLGQRTSASDDNVNAIRQAQAETWDDTVSIFPGPVLWHQIPLGDGVHFSSSSENAELRNLWQETIEAAVYNGSNGRGPKVSSIADNGNVISVTFDQDLIDPGGNYTADVFVVKDDGVPATINSVVRSSTSTIDITLQNPPTGTVTVSMGSGSLSAVASLPIVPKGAGTFTLPAEPFVELSTQPPTPPQTTAHQLIDGGRLIS